MTERGPRRTERTAPKDASERPPGNPLAPAPACQYNDTCKCTSAHKFTQTKDTLLLRRHTLHFNPFEPYKHAYKTSDAGNTVPIRRLNDAHTASLTLKCD